MSEEQEQEDAKVSVEELKENKEKFFAPIQKFLKKPIIADIAVGLAMLCMLVLGTMYGSIHTCREAGGVWQFNTAQSIEDKLMFGSCANIKMPGYVYRDGQFIPEKNYNPIDNYLDGIGWNGTVTD